MESIRIIDTQDSPVLVVQPGQARLEDVERHLIMATLRRTRYNRTKTAKLLGIGIRTLQRKLKQYSEERGLAATQLQPDIPHSSEGMRPVIAAVV
jgi:DNA-binding NtrC family response regulator